MPASTGSRAVTSRGIASDPAAKTWAGARLSAAADGGGGVGCLRSPLTRLSIAVVIGVPLPPSRAGAAPAAAGGLALAAGRWRVTEVTWLTRSTLTVCTRTGVGVAPPSDSRTTSLAARPVVTPWKARLVSAENPFGAVSGPAVRTLRVFQLGRATSSAVVSKVWGSSPVPGTDWARSPAGRTTAVSVGSGWRL